MSEPLNDDNNVEPDNEKSVEGEAPEDEWENCRLRKTLNEDCLLKIMEYLNIHDLYEMGKMDKYFENLIREWIIGKRIVNFRGIDQALRTEMFAMFGKSLKRFILYEMVINTFIDNVMRYCTPGRLLEVELNLKHPYIVDNIGGNNVPESMVFFTNLHKLRINALNFEHFGSYGEFLSCIVGSALKLHSLHLSYIDIDREWMIGSRIVNLRELIIHKPRHLSLPDLRNFLRTTPNLEVFKFNGSQDITKVGKTLLKYCPNLQTFCDVHAVNPHRQFMLDGLNRYNFLASFKNLECITLTSYTHCGGDLYYPLSRLATKNIKELRIIADLEHSVDFSVPDRDHIMQCSFEHFLSLNVLEVEIKNFRLSGELKSEFIMRTATQLKNLRKFTFESDRLVNAHKIIQLLPQIRVFSMSKIIFKHLPVEMRKIVRTLRALRQTTDGYDQNIMELIVNIEQWRELQVYKDINKLMRTVIDRDVEPYNHVGPPCRPVVF